MGIVEGVSSVLIGAAGSMLALAGLIFLLLWAARASRQDHAERRKAASARGWRYMSDAPGTYLYRVTGSTADLPWQLVADSGGGDDSGSTVWSTDAIQLTDLEVMIRARMTHEQTKGTWGKAALNLTGVVASMVGLPRPELLDLVRTGIEHRPERTAVRENFIIFARDSCLARTVVTPDVEEALARWAMCPHITEQQRRSLVVDLGPPSLRVHCTGILANGAAMSLLIGLGTALAEACQHAAASSPDSLAVV